MSKSVASWFILVLLALVWGSSFILMKKGMEVFSPEEVAGLRIVTASVFLLPFLVKYYKINFKKYWLPIFLMGLFGNLIPAFLFTTAETGISSSLTGMLNALTPLFTIIFAVIFFKGKTNLFQIVGIVIGLIGALLLMYFNVDTGQHQNGIKYCLMVVLATVFYAISVNIIRKYLYNINSITATVWSFSFIGPIALIYLFIRTHFINTLHEKEHAVSALGYIIILGVIGSALSVILFNSLIKMAGAVFASSVTYLIPVVAIVWGIFDQERIVWQQFTAMAVIFGAIYLINRK